ncbi:hypothetical protein [Methylibium sp. Root1272]|uniref:hypothetical protein n=1 Tax=Methylibium sp. Root1272 TaxID=1736441 RepID=UPI0006F1C9C2|nr:hypothetical protein [Methylibium sp. Root1272]KQW70053.1 hypothetical protein ASC67_06135 [Methylibium sp. Root1272]
MTTTKKDKTHGSTADANQAFTGAELLAAFSAAVAGGKTAQEAVKLIAPLIKGDVTLLVQVLRGGTTGTNHEVSFRLTNPTAHGLYLQRVSMVSPEDVPVSLLHYQAGRIGMNDDGGHFVELPLPRFVEPGSSLELRCVFDVAQTRARIFNKGYGKIKFTCDAMTAMDPADTVVGFLIREEAV